jgi:hypothetical protein
MMKSNMTALTFAGILSVSSLAAFAQSSDSNAPVDKGGMPPSTEMEAGSQSGGGTALPPGSVGGGNGDDASGSSTSPGTGSGSTSGGSTMGGDSSGGGMDGGTGTGTSGSGSGSSGASGSSGSSQ